MRHKKPLIGSAVVLSLLFLTFAGCSKVEKLAPALVLEKAYVATTEEVTSFHITMSFAVTAEGLGEIDASEMEGDYVAPDRSRMKQTHGQELFEMIIVGSEVYQRESGSSRWEVEGRGSARAMGLKSLVDTEKILEFMESTDESVTQFDDGAIDGVECLRYRITIDPLEKLVQNMEEETDPELKEARRMAVENVREMETTQEIEVWIGKEDYLVRQIKSVQTWISDGHAEFGWPNVVIPEGTRYTITTTLKFSAFNEPVEIEAPTVLA